MKKILITGASGMLGSALSTKLSSDFDVYPYCKSSYNGINVLDVTDIDQVYTVINFVNPDIIINCAAYTNVDLAELNKFESRQVNVSGLLNILKVSSKNMKIIHISTDYIFDGLSGNYLESDIKNPLNYYGKTKLEAENYLIGSNINYLIIRPNVLYTYDLMSSNFFSWVINSLTNNTTISVVNDQFNNPVYIPDLLDIIKDSILLDYSGISHFGSEDTLSRYDFSLKICNTFNLNEKLINEIKTSDLNQIARRPLNTSLNCTKIESELEINLYSTDYSFNRIKSYL